MSDHRETDGACAARAASGDERAFSELMRRHKQAVFRFVRRYVGDPDEAYDLTQDTFVSAWRAIDRLDPSRPFDVWLRRIALNKCRDWGRRRTFRRLLGLASGATTDEIEDVADAAPTPEVVVLDAQILVRLDGAIANLPAQLKEPLLLVVLEQKSQQEAADLLGVSRKAIETRIHRARAKLTEALAAVDPPGHAAFTRRR